MTNKDLGYRDSFDKYKTELGLDAFETGRIILEHKERYIIKTPTQEYDAELMGNLRFTAKSRYDFPAVGDWVAFQQYDEGKALIHAIFPRQTILERQAVGKYGQVQIIATNIDYALIVQAVDRDFNINRLERYLTICNTAKVIPIVVLSKIDLIEKSELNNMIQQINQRIHDIQILYSSSITEGYQQIENIIKSGKTYCLLGSSGVGKSTLINHLSGKEWMKTGEISTSVNKGKHVTSHRELIVLNKGGILIDNPGMREVGMTETASGIALTFETIMEYAKSCKYADCSHLHESGCAVIEALENGEIDEDAYHNYQKMKKEEAHFESDAMERKKKDKDLGKVIKHFKKQGKNNTY